MFRLYPMLLPFSLVFIYTPTTAFMLTKFDHRTTDSVKSLCRWDMKYIHPTLLRSSNDGMVKGEDLRTDQMLYPPRNPIFENKNIITKYFPVASAFFKTLDPEVVEMNWDSNMRHLWRFLSGKNEITGSMGIDVAVEFRDADEGAEKLIQKCQSHSIHSRVGDTEYENTKEYLVDVLSYFQKSVMSACEIETYGNVLYKARIVSSRGRVGQKCPRWHVDHTSLRLVLSIVGPGCIFIPKEKEDSSPGCVDRKALNGLDEDDTKKANAMILPQGENGVAVQAAAGDAVLILGRAWEESEDGVRIQAAPHRSPDIGENQFRVLLTVDIVPKL